MPSEILKHIPTPNHSNSTNAISKKIKMKCLTCDSAHSKPIVIVMGLKKNESLYILYQGLAH